ncbi:hypothetical protein AFCDBAGC_1390 [Methylobacterium cerastii]|uniref:Uncharacterized protein n=1 Tax=Methylobacterium cerastii TaxID=932741 RepID=A0ABQ4QE95_9HYPH|nr:MULTISPECIES: hypothetical protein [Methylobacterium]TXM69374.1 hypothetical protein FV229_05525 [Methylobacterium sp. WL120]TXN83852.1 hypothetical protein FV234_05160 [Methylobacterium sp. WL8]GJD43538.1 hypothetical protein AFCDBAGC_1390 [Methylobacterium cerastii]
MMSSRAGAFVVAVSVVTFGSVAARAESCRASVGERDSARLVERCLAVSPATHPPCNASNACALIESEIVRSCRLFDDGTAPAFCRDY